MKLTEKNVTALKSGERDVFAWDDAMPGFAVRCKPSGRKSFLIQYRNKAAQSRRFTIGTVGVLEVEQAREKARKLLVAVKEGADPASDRIEERGAPTVEDTCRRYLVEHAEVRKKPSSVREDRRLIERRIVPAVGRLKIGALTREQVMKLGNDLRGTPTEANRTLALLSKVCNLAEAWNLRPDGSNPVRHVERFKEQPRERFLNEAEIARLGAVMAEAEAGRAVHQPVLDALRFLALTGMRLSEALALKWSCIDAEAACARLPDSKTGRKVVPLGGPALTLLAGLPRAGDFVFPSPTKPDAPLSVNLVERAWRRLRGKADLGDARVHDLRHGFGTFAGMAGGNAFLVRDLLGHATVAMTGRYVNRDADPLRALADRVAGRVAAALAGQSAEVVLLAKRQS